MTRACVSLLLIALHLEHLETERSQWMRNGAQRKSVQRFCQRARAFFTIFCSSTRNARTMRSRTAPPLSTPPYARCTVFLLFGIRLLLYCVGRRCGT